MRSIRLLCLFFFLTDPPTTQIYTLSLHDALPICHEHVHLPVSGSADLASGVLGAPGVAADRKSTRLNASHMSISYAVFCLKKKKYTLMLFPCTKEKKNNTK